MTPIINRNDCVGKLTQQLHETGTDLTGRDRLVSNVIFNWAGHFVFIVTGFILPRMIDHRLGQDLLGVWDFVWSLVSYFELVSAGVSSSVSRYVARYRMASDPLGVSAVASSAICILAMSGLLALGLTITSALLLPYLFSNRLGENMQEAQWVVFFLGTGIAVEIALQPYNGILTGCHRWEVQNIIKSGWHVTMVAIMIIALVKGQGLRMIALIYLICIVLAYVTRIFFAYRVCEGLQIHWSFVRWSIIKKHLIFGVKTLIPKISQLLLNQTASILIVAYLGPAMLALYCRPRSLTLTIQSLVQKMSMTLTPTISSLHRVGDVQAIQQMATKSVRYSTYMALPMVLMLAIFGGPILQLWMGPQYAQDLLPAILAIGYLAMITQLPVWNILMGLNAHGRVGLALFITSICSIGLTAFALSYFKVGLTGVALAMVFPLTVLSALYLPVTLCKRIGLNIKTYFLSVALEPALRIIPFALCLAITRFILHDNPGASLVLSIIIACAVLAVIYWRHVLPDRIKTKIFRMLSPVLNQTKGSV